MEGRTIGIETAIIIGLTAASVRSGVMAAKSQSRAVADKAALDAQNLKKATVAKAAKQKVAFLSSGLTLEGTPMGVLEQTFETGIADVKQLVAGANTQSKNIMAQARAKALSQLAGTAASLYGAGAFTGTPPVGAGAFSAPTSARTTAGGIRLPAGLPKPVGG